MNCSTPFSFFFFFFFPFPCFSSFRVSHGRTSSSSSKPSKKQISDLPKPFDSEHLPPTLISDIQPVLVVANQIELEWPRAAFLCRFHAFERAHMTDRCSRGRGVLQFKKTLLQWLKQDDEDTILMRKEKCDVREITRTYLEYEKYIREHSGDSDKSAQLVSARGIASVLYEVLKSVASGTVFEVPALTLTPPPPFIQTIDEAENDDAKSEFYQPYNILPLDLGGKRQAIMRLPEVFVGPKIEWKIEELRNPKTVV